MHRVNLKLPNTKHFIVAVYEFNVFGEIFEFIFFIIGRHKRKQPATTVINQLFVCPNKTLSYLSYVSVPSIYAKTIDNDEITNIPVISKRGIPRHTNRSCE